MAQAHQSTVSTPTSVDASGRKKNTQGSLARIAWTEEEVRDRRGKEKERKKVKKVSYIYILMFRATNSRKSTKSQSTSKVVAPCGH